MTLKTTGTAALLTAALCLSAAYAEETAKPAAPPAMGGNPQMMQQHMQEMMKQKGGMPGMQHGNTPATPAK
jgi:hypothetical protein